MNTKNIGREDISALVDNELSDEQVDSALAGLYADGPAAWDIYHQIGDVMRSDEMAHAFSPDFAARLSARLDAEPAIVAPLLKSARMEQAMFDSVQRKSSTSFRRFAIPTAAAAVVAIAVISNPRLMMATQNGATAGAMAPVAANLQSASNYTLVASASAPSLTAGDAAGETVKDGVILRDPRIDEYLLAHQRYSPSLYSTAQYARMAPTSDSDK